MAAKKNTKPDTAAVLDEELEVAEAQEPSTKQIINEGINRAAEELKLGTENRYKAMRALAFQAFANAIENGEFDALVDQAVANADELPAGWQVKSNRTASKPAKSAAPAESKPTSRRSTTRKTAAEKAATEKGTTSGRRRPSRAASK